MSKPLCAIGLLKLYDKGLVDIESHPGKYIPEAEDFDSRITIRMMLHHRSGIQCFTQIPDITEKYSLDSSDEIRLALRELSKKPLNFAPDTSTEYSNINFLISALIIENVTGITYADYMRREVFEPLSMKDTYADFTSPFIAGGAVGYTLEDGKITAVSRRTGWTLGGADVVSTVADVYALNLAIKHNMILKESTWKMVLTPHSESDFGLGCIVMRNWHGKKRIQHNGGSRGFRTIHVYIPEDDFDIIFLSNCDFNDSRTVVCETVYEEIYGASGEPALKVEMDKGYI
jgi:CubicO group peptidase (beta-lactamase class C family)